MRKLLLSLCLCSLIVGSGALLGQSSNGTLGGSVTDPTGARITQATVTATNTATGLNLKAIASDTGDYLIVQVPPGVYNLEASAPGFKTLTRKDIKVDVAGKVTVDLTLEVGAISERVTVTAETPLLRVQDAQTGEIIDSKMISNLPQLNRNPLEMLRLSGDVSGTMKTGSMFSNQNDTRINGGRASGLDVLVDGNTVLSGKGHFVPPSAAPSMEQVSEFKVITNGIAAEYGRVSGGLVEVATTGGTNQLHGEGFEYFRNQLFNANSWETNWQSPYVPGKKAPRTQFHQNDYGFRIGGPIVLPKLYDGKNKTFFFFNYEGQNYRQAAVPRLGMSVTDQERTGDLSDLFYGGVGPNMYDPLGEIGKDDQGRLIKLTPFPGQVIPESRIDPLAKIIMSYIPQSNREHTPGFTQQNAYMGMQATKWDDQRWETRIDHNFTDNSRMIFRFNRDYWNNSVGQWYSELSPADEHKRQGSIQASLGWVWTLTPTTILDVRGSVMHDPNYRGPEWNVPNQHDWPIDPLMKQLTRDIPADLLYRTWSADSGWGGNNNLGNQDMVFQSLDAATNYSAVVAVTKIWGKHTLKTGFETRRFYDNHWEDLFGQVDYGANGGNGVGQLNYQSNQWINSNWYANTFGAFLLGIPDSATKQSTLNLANATNYYAGYIQDDFRVTRRLTLNLGLRWDMETPLTERHDSLSMWDPDRPSAYSLPAGYNWNDQLSAAGLTPEQISLVPTPSWVTAGKFPNGYACFVASSECKDRTQTKYHPWQFAPRFGAAYQLNSKTVLRGSFGVMYMTSTGDYWNGWVVNASHAASNATDRDPVTGNIAHNNQSLFYSNQYVPFVADTAYLNYNISSGYQGAGTNVNMHPPREYAWNLSLQREIGWKTLVELNYNGNHGSELVTDGPMSAYPENLVDPKYSALFKTMVGNPIAGQINPTGLYSNAKVPLGSLMLAAPYNGGLTIYGQNIGRSNYNSASIKLRKQMSQGVTFLATYTYSRLKDDVGNIGGTGQKSYQSFQTIDDLYGYSPQDMTHRFSFYHDVQLPFGKGRRFLGAPSSVGAKVLNGVIGGWEYAGIWLYHSGTPLSFVPQTTSISQYSGVPVLWGNITGDMENVTPSDYKNDSQILTSGLVDPTKQTIRRFDASRFTQPLDMTPGNVGPIYPWIRNPGATSYDGSLMKNFNLYREDVRFQLRVEAENMFNIRGLGAYNTSIGSPTFGLITSSGQNPRNMQISGRIFF